MANVLHRFERAAVAVSVGDHTKSRPEERAGGARPHGTAIPSGGDWRLHEMACHTDAVGGSFKCESATNHVAVQFADADQKVGSGSERRDWPGKCSSTYRITMRRVRGVLVDP
jgi:hypothetical protein